MYIYATPMPVIPWTIGRTSGIMPSVTAGAWIAGLRVVRVCWRVTLGLQGDDNDNDITANG